MVRHIFGAAVEVQFSEVTGRLVILAVVGGVVLTAAWSLRYRMVAKELGRLQRVAALPDVGPDTSLLLRRLLQRQTGRVIGIGVLYLVLGSLLARSGEGLPWLVLCIPFGAALGTGVGQWQAVGAPSRPRVAQIRRRELGDYVVPLERLLLPIAWAFPVAALALLIAGMRAGSPVTATAWVSLALVAGVALATGVIAVAIGRVLGSAVEMATPAGLVWEEIVRAVTLRDLLGSGTLLAAAGSTGVVWWAGAQPGWPAWLETAAYVLGLGALLLLGTLLALGLADSHYRWARAHALAGVTT